MGNNKVVKKQDQKKMMSHLACSDCAKNCVNLHQAKEGTAPKIARFFKVIMGNDHDKLMYLPPGIAPVMKQLSGKKIVIKDAEGGLWPVVLTTVNGKLALTNGWVPFFRRCHLEEFSLLTFEYEDGTDSLFVRVYSKNGSETLQNTCEKAANNVIHQSSEPDFLEDELEVVSQQIPDKSSSSGTIPDVFEEAEQVVGSDSESADEVIETDRRESVDACGKRKGGAHHCQSKRPTLEQQKSKEGDVQNTRSVGVESPKCPELPALSPVRKYMGLGQVVYLIDPEGRLWPFYNQDKRSVKLSEDKWGKLCIENNITEQDECRFEVEEADLGVYRVSVASCSPAG